MPFSASDATGADRSRGPRGVLPWLARFRWLPVPLFVALYLVLDAHDSGSFEPRLLLPALNIVFLTGVSLLVAWLAARSYLLGQSEAVLLLGCGSLAFGTASAYAAVTVFYGMNPDYTVTVHNIGACLAAACCLAGTCLAARPAPLEPRQHHAGKVVAYAYALVVVLIVLVAVGDLDGLFPDFFVAGRGPTIIRQAILGSAVAMFVLSAAIFRVLGARSSSAFVSWYSLGLLLIGLGLGGVFTQHAVGSAVSWLGRAAQYLGCLYMYAAVISVPGDTRPWNIPLDQIFREAHDRYRSLVDLSPDAVLVHVGGKYRFANPAAVRLFHARTAEELIGKEVLELVHPDDRQAVASRIAVARAGAATSVREARLLRLDGSIVDVEAVGAPVAFRGTRAVQVVIRDVSERNRIERALQERERRLRQQNAILEGMNRIFREALAHDTEEDVGRTCLAVAEEITASRFGSISLLNQEGMLDDIALSDAGWAASRQDKPDASSTAPAGFKVHGLHGYVVRRNEAFFTNDPASHPASIGAPDGPPPLTAFLGAPLVLGERVIGMVGLANRPGGYGEADLEALRALAPAITQALTSSRETRERKQAEDALREMDRRKNEFLATLSHELRNPLAPIRYAVELLDHDATAPEPKRVIDRQLAHLVRLVDDLLDLTRIASNKIQLRKQRVELAQVVRQGIEAASPDIRAAAHAFDVSLPDETVWLDADPDRVAQVVTNLLNNAARYTPAEGRIALRATLDGDDVVIAVSDNGIGLRSEDLEPVFEMFTQLGEPGVGGLGIGLALVKGIVEQHGGRVEARSDGPGRGSEFRVWLPRAAAPAPASDTVGAPVSAPSAPLRVLVVDDNMDAARMMQTLLEFDGHQARVAFDALRALNVLESFPADVGLFDIGLPGIDGYELARRVRANPATCAMYLIALTGWGQESDRRRARESGFDAHVTKPADPDELARMLANAGSNRIVN